VGYGSVFFSGTSVSSMESAANALSKGSTASGDVGIGIIYDGGTISASSSKSFSYLTSLDNREIATILTQLATAAAPAAASASSSSSTSSTALQVAVQRATQQTTEAFGSGAVPRAALTVGASGRPPAQVTLPQAASLPVVDLSGGLAFVELAAPPPSVVALGASTLAGGGTTAATESSADIAPPTGVTGTDPLGFMRVFVTRGGINMPKDAAPDAAAESARRAGQISR
jgi:hypothetical protein